MSLFDNLKKVNTVETDCAIGDDDFNFNPFNGHSTVKWGMQCYRIIETTHDKCLLAVGGSNQWVSINELKEVG